MSEKINEGDANGLEIVGESDEVVHGNALVISGKAILAAAETNDNGVSVDVINQFVDGLNLAFGVKRQVVLERLKIVLTPEKLGHLMFWQSNGHELDVTKLGPNGQLEFDSCSAESPLAFRNVNYFEALKLANDNGANLMNLGKFNFIKRHFTLDENSCSWLYSPTEGSTSAYYSYRWDALSMSKITREECTGFRVSLVI